VDVLLVVVEELVLFLGESVGLEVDCKNVVGRWIDVVQHIRLFTFVHYGGEVEGVGVALLSTVRGVSGLIGSKRYSYASHPFAFGCFALACLMYLSPSTNLFHR
jgi:hypothetical protein